MDDPAFQKVWPTILREAKTLDPRLATKYRSFLEHLAYRAWRAGRVNLNDLASEVHAANIKWWQDPVTKQPIKRNKGELLALIHSEISEALEGERKDLMDDHLPHRKMAEVELADAIIRILDYAHAFGYDIQGALDEKMAYNAQREDHKHEARLILGGKQF